MDERQRQAFERAVDIKKQASNDASTDAEQRARAGDAVRLDGSGQMQPGLQTSDRASQDTLSVRQKNSAKGKKTADKWNQ
jgi:hypothetical protein